MSTPNDFSWSQVSGDPPAERTWIPVVVTSILTVVPLFFQLRHLGHVSGPALPLLIVLVVLIAIARSAPFVALGLSAALVLAVGRWVPAVPIGIVIFGVLLAMTWAVTTGVIAPRWRRWPATAAFRIALLPLIAVDLLLLLQTGLRLPGIGLLAGIAVVALALVAPRPLTWMTAWMDPSLAPLQRVAGANARFLDRIGHPIGRAIGAVAMLPAAVVTIALWIGYRIARFDPLRHGVSGRSGWFSRQGDDLSPERSFAEVITTQSGARTGFFRRVVATAPLLLLLAGVTYAVWPEVGSNEPTERDMMSADNCHTGPDPSMDEQESSPLVVCESSEFALRARFDAVTGFRFEDYEGLWLNVVDGERRTWQPPACDDCERITVWWFGGSGAFGYYQSDELSLPSQVAQAAWDRGIALEISNYAQPGWTLGQGVRRFVELTATEEPPDVVVFYDGANDVVLQRDRNWVGRGDDESEVSFAEEPLDDVLADGPFNTFTQAAPREVHDTPELSSADLTEHAMSRYRRNLELATKYAESLGTVPIFVWQPILPLAPERIGNPDATSPGDVEFWRSARPAIKSGLPSRVLDLTGSLDKAPGVVFKDYVHTNELGAQIVAEALVDAELETFRAAVQGPVPPTGEGG